MIVPRHASMLFMRVASLALPAAATAEETAPAAGMGMQMRHGMGHDGMGGKACPMHKGGMQGGDRPCLMGQNAGCRMRGSDMDDKRLDMLEKRMDMMQMMLETLLKKQAGAKR